MNSVYIPAFAALAGSAIGALASSATTWLTQNAQERSKRFGQAMDRRERLYGEFIREAAKLFSDAITQEAGDAAKFADLYAHIGQLRLFAPAEVVAEAEKVMQQVVEAYALPIVDFHNPREEWKDELDVLRAFSDACRKDLGLAMRTGLRAG